MNKLEIIELINEVVDTDPKLDENCLIAECEDLDSMTLLTIFLKLKEYGCKAQITDFINCKTIADIIDLVVA